MIFVDSKKKSKETLMRLYPNAILADVTSKSNSALVKLSPFYPHGEIPIPFSPNHSSMSVEGVWQGLKVFEKAGVDIDMFYNDTMKNIKRTVRKFGNPLGHSKGIDSKELLGYIEARIFIYIPTYKWVLENKVSDIIMRLKEAQKTQDIVLLDYDTNEDIFNTKSPLSHAHLIKMYVDNNYPNTDKLLQKVASTVVSMRQPVKEEGSAKYSLEVVNAKKTVISKPKAKRNTTSKKGGPNNKASFQTELPF